VNLDLIEPMLTGLIASLSHTNASLRLFAFWEDQPREMVDPATKGIILLTITSTTEKGTDDKIQTQDLNQPNGQELADHYHGVRAMTLTIKAESYDQSSGFTARAYCERIRNGLKWASSRATLRTQNVSLGQIMNPVPLGEARDDHQISIAAVDVILNVAVEHDDPVRYGYIEHVKITDVGTGIEIDV
jgi:hypothetical protein